MFKSFVGKFGVVAEFCIFTHPPCFAVQCDPQPCRAGRNEPCLAQPGIAGSAWSWSDSPLPGAAGALCAAAGPQVSSRGCWCAGALGCGSEPRGSSGMGFIPGNVGWGSLCCWSCGTGVPWEHPWVLPLPVQVSTGHALLLPGTEPVVV